MTCIIYVTIGNSIYRNQFESFITVSYGFEFVVRRQDGVSAIFMSYSFLKKSLFFISTNVGFNPGITQLIVRVVNSKITFGHS